MPQQSQTGPGLGGWILSVPELLDGALKPCPAHRALRGVSGSGSGVCGPVITRGTGRTGRCPEGAAQAGAGARRGQEPSQVGAAALVLPSRVSRCRRLELLQLQPRSVGSVAALPAGRCQASATLRGPGALGCSGRLWAGGVRGRAAGGALRDLRSPACAPGRAVPGGPYPLATAQPPAQPFGRGGPFSA